ncbi:MAG: c-type cytochrome [Rhodocyclaceae bacterium]|nr:MAG: c-type cytochrome [Rhodocyclaceae bacterium]
MKRFIPFSIALGALSLSTPSWAVGDAAQGKLVYQARCTACHSVDFNGVGPAHKGVFGRRVGQAAGYTYSPALQAAKVTWTAETLDRWLSDPEKFLPGQRMGISLDGARERADVIAYLKSLSPRE